MMRYFRLTSVLFALAATVAAMTPGVASAQPGAANLQVSGPVGATVGDTVELVATLTDGAGEPVADVQLLVEERLGFFDTKAGDIVVASAATNGDGIAVIRYVARRDGDRHLLVRFPGNKDLAETSTGFDFTVAAGAATYTVEAPPGIPGVNRFVVIAVLVLVWGTMLIVAGHVTAIAREGAASDLGEAEASG